MLGIAQGLRLYLADLNKFRIAGLVREKLDPWLRERRLDSGSVDFDNLRDFRILVCGKAGVGKSTLINKVFGIPLVSPKISSYNIDKILIEL
jgi:predicted GTPase